MTTSKRAIGREAADWVVVLQGKDATARQLQEFRDWLLQSPLHVGAYFKAESVWLALRQVDADRKVDIDALLSSPDNSNVVTLRPGTVSGQSSESDSGPRSGFGRRWLAAAGLAVVALGGLLGWGLHETAPRFQTAVGEQHTSRLDDGSVIELNTQSELRVRYSRGERRIEMVAGEAFFSVQKDAARPFVVAVDDSEVTAVGTAFNVYRQSAATVVTVSEGIVSLSSKNSGDRVLVEAGEQAVVAGGRAKLISMPGLPAKALAWRQNQIVSVGESLQNVIVEINRYNERKLIIKDPKLSDRRISGVFSVHNPEIIVQFLQRSAGVSVEDAPDGSWLLLERKTSSRGE